jgi:hypothetical protein
MFSGTSCRAARLDALKFDDARCRPPENSTLFRERRQTTDK